MEIESKKQILARRKEIEQELIDMLKETESDFSLQHVKDAIFYEEDNDDMMKVVAMFDRGGDTSELDNILELVTDAWNYFPHKALEGISPTEKTLEAKDLLSVKMLSEEEISELKKKSIHRSGVWEIDWGPETFSGSLDITLTIVAHQESYFILEMYASPSDEIGKGIKALINATKKEITLPDIILVRDKILADEITPLAGLLGCEIRISKLKAIPQIRRDMRRHFG